MKRKWFIVDAHQHIHVGIYVYATEPPKLTERQRMENEIKRFKEWFKKYGVSYGAVSNISPMVDRVWKTRHGGNEFVVELMKETEGKVIGQYAHLLQKGLKNWE